MEQALLAGIVLLLPIRALSPVVSSIVSIGVVLALPVLFVAVFRMPRYRAGGLVLTLFALILFTAPLLWFAADERTVSEDGALAAMLTIAVAFVHLSTLLWARSKIGTHPVVVLYAVGMIVQVLLTLSHTSGNPWKFGLAVPTTLLALAIASRARPFWTVLVFAIAMALSIHFDFRSFVGLPLVAMFVWAWNRRSAIAPGWKIFGFVLVSAVAYVGGTQAALAGWLGERNRIVTQMQIAESGSVLAGGRVESAAAWALFIERPIGLGPGVLPTVHDVLVGQAALVQRGVAIDGDYVTDYLFGAGVKLHSIAADLWVNYGLAGLGLALLILWIAILALFQGLKERSTPGFVFFAVVLTLWNLAFSPIGTNLWETILMVAVLMGAQSYRAQPNAGATQSKAPQLTRSKIIPQRPRAGH